MAIGLSQDAGGAFPQNGTNISGFSAPVAPDKGFTIGTQPRIKAVRFGDGYEQRKVMGLNTLIQNFDLNFNNRTKAEIDDLEAFFVARAGVEKFRFTLPDTNGGAGTDSANETTIKVICDSWSKTHTYGDYYSLSAKIRRIYEA